MKTTIKGFLGTVLVMALISMLAITVFAQEGCTHLEVVDGICSACQAEVTIETLDHDHLYDGEANCQGHWCEICEDFYGEPNPEMHTFGNYVSTALANCNDNAKESAECIYCDAVDVREISNTATHNWSDATCTSPMTCIDCGDEHGNSLGHDWIDATLEAPKTCAECNLAVGSPMIAIGGLHTPADWFTVVISVIIMLMGKICGLA